MFDAYTVNATTLIVFPLIVAALVLILPMPREGLALVAVASQVLPIYWLVTTIIPDLPTDGSFGFETNKAWLTDLGVRYHVGLDGLSLVMVCMTVLVMTCALGYAAWEGRYRGRPYFALLLLLESALILVFCARDLILFYVGFEAMLIPFYFLIGIWGGPERRKGTLKFLIYTFVGTLLMLVGMIVIGLRGRLVRPDRGRHVELELGVRGVHPRLRGQGAGVAAARLAARRVPQRAARGGGRAVGRGVEGRRVRLPAHRAADLPRARVGVPLDPGRGGGDRAAVRLAARVPPARRPRRDRLLVDRARWAS